MQGAEAVLVLLGHDDGHGEIRVFKSAHQRQITKAAEEHALQPSAFKEVLKQNPHWLTAKPIRAIIEEWVRTAETVGSDATLTIFLDCCKAGNALQQLTGMSVGNRRIRVYSPCAADEAADGYALTSLLFNRNTESHPAIFASMHPCFASTPTYNSACFTAARHPPCDANDMGAACSAW